MNTRSGYIVTNDRVRLYYERIGNGPAVLIPNGLYLLADFKRLAEKRTLIFYDVRNRGLSDSVTDLALLERGILNDVDDLEAVRLYFNLREIDLIGHSYIALMNVLYALKYGQNLRRMVQIGAIQPDARTEYSPDLMGQDRVVREVMAKLSQLQKEQPLPDPQERCEKFWSVLREMYVMNPADARRINWGRCDLPNERAFRKYWTEIVLPSIQKASLTARETAMLTSPVLIVHGKKDRSSPYGGGLDWGLLLPNSRLLSIEEAAHAPWIEEPEQVFGAITTFLDGQWPEMAHKVHPLDSKQEL